MFSREKKARSLMGEPEIKNDEFNLIHIFMIIVFIIFIIFITYTDHKVNEKIDKDEKTNNPAIKTYQEIKELDKEFDIYGDVNPDNQKIYNLDEKK